MREQTNKGRARKRPGLGESKGGEAYLMDHFARERGLKKRGAGTSKLQKGRAVTRVIGSRFCPLALAAADEVRWRAEDDERQGEAGAAKQKEAEQRLDGQRGRSVGKLRRRRQTGSLVNFGSFGQAGGLQYQVRHKGYSAAMPSR